MVTPEGPGVANLTAQSHIQIIERTHTEST